MFTLFARSGRLVDSVRLVLLRDRRGRVQHWDFLTLVCWTQSAGSTTALGVTGSCFTGSLSVLAKSCLHSVCFYRTETAF